MYRGARARHDAARGRLGVGLSQAAERRSTASLFWTENYNAPRGDRGPSVRPLLCPSVAPWLLSVVAGLLTSAVTLGEFAHRGSTVLVGVMTVALLTLFTSVLVRLEHGGSPVQRVKEALARAYVGSLDESNLNPEKSQG